MLLFDPALTVTADALDDVERLRIATGNRLRILTLPADQPDADGVCRGFGLDDAHPAIAATQVVLDGLVAIEAQTVLTLQRQVRAHPLGGWVRSTVGLGEKQVGRLLAAVGDPYWHAVADRPRSVSALWAYCVPGDELVSTPRGSFPISNIRVGDTVYNADGGTSPVTRVLSRQVDEDIVRIDARKTLPLRVTAEHPVLVARWKRTPKLNRWTMTSKEYRRADEVRVGDYLVIPRVREDAKVTPPDEEVASFWGRFVGDGHTTFGVEGRYERGRSGITFGSHERFSGWLDIARRRVAAAYVSTTSQSTCTVYFGRLAVAKRFRDLFGHKATTKRIPAEIMQAPDQTSRSFLQGYLSADGHTAVDGKVMAGTVSKGLALQLQLLSGRLGALPSVYLGREAGGGVIQNRAVNLHDQYRCHWSAGDAPAVYPDRNGPQRKIFYRQDDDAYYVEVTSVGRESYVGDVYDLSCGGSFLVNNVAVHNCGLHVVEGARAPKRRRGERINWSPQARSRAHLVAVSCARQPTSTYRPVYLGRRERTAGTHPEWTAGHSHADALRVVAKAVVRDLWRESARAHGVDPDVGRPPA